MIKSSEYISRIKKIAERCRQEDLDAFLVTSGDNLYYLTGKSFMPFERPFILIVHADGTTTFLLPKLELEHLQVIKHIDRFETYYEYPSPKEESWPNRLTELMKDVEKVGTDLYTRSEIYEYLKQGCQVHCFDWVYTQRYIKSAAEVEMLRETAKYVRRSMQDFLKTVRRGTMVLETLAPGKKAQKQALIDRKFDVDFLAYNFLCGGWPGAQSAEPHSIPYPLGQFKDGPNVMIMTYRIDGYAVELERTFFTSRPTEEERKRYTHMMEARKIALSLCRPGVKTHDIDKAVRDYLFTQGYESNIIHRTGHGMGVSNHEGPFLAVGSETILEPGMVLTVEPGLYFKGHGAYRHSDTIVITDDGYECLTDIPTDIDSQTILKSAGLALSIKRMILKRMVK